jgi:hypothetical protein
MVGETVYNLRAALDYLVYSLVHLGTARKPKDTQFPISRTQQQFRKAVARHLREVTGAHRAAIANRQSYNGGEWLTRLQELSNPDKHHRLVVVEPELRGTRAGAIRSGSDGIRIDPTESHHWRVIAFEADRLSVVEVLDSLRANVTEAIGSFAPDFA